jgi:hypothetical protein
VSCSAPRVHSGAFANIYALELKVLDYALVGIDINPVKSYFYSLKISGTYGPALRKIRITNSGRESLTIIDAFIESKLGGFTLLNEDQLRGLKLGPRDSVEALVSYQVQSDQGETATLNIHSNKANASSELVGTPVSAPSTEPETTKAFYVAYTHDQRLFAKMLTTLSGVRGQTNAGKIETFELNFGDGSGWQEGWQDERLFHAYEKAGAYTIIGRAYDNEGDQLPARELAILLGGQDLNVHPSILELSEGEKGVLDVNSMIMPPLLGGSSDSDIASVKVEGGDLVVEAHGPGTTVIRVEDGMGNHGVALARVAEEEDQEESKPEDETGQKPEDSDDSQLDPEEDEPGAGGEEESQEGEPNPSPVVLEGENGRGAGRKMWRSEASGDRTLLLEEGQTCEWSFSLDARAAYNLSVRYSNDNYGPKERVTVYCDGLEWGSFNAKDTGNYGHGWNQFVQASLGQGLLERGAHTLRIEVEGGDGYGVEIDKLTLTP